MLPDEPLAGDSLHYYHPTRGWQAAPVPTAPDADPPDFAAAAQARLDHIAGQRAQPPPHPLDLDPPSLVAFREHLSRSGARETCMACDVDRWAARRESHPRPTIAKVCLHCGFIAYFDTVIVGVLPPGPVPLPLSLDTTPPPPPARITAIVDGQELVVLVRP